MVTHDLLFIEKNSSYISLVVTIDLCESGALGVPTPSPPSSPGMLENDIVLVRLAVSRNAVPLMPPLNPGCGPHAYLGLFMAASLALAPAALLCLLPTVSSGK